MGPGHTSQQAALRVSSLSRGLVLHVDDERPIRDSTRLLLTSHDYQVASAATAREALQLVAAGLVPDVLILDFHLGGDVDGAELAQQLRRTLGYSPPVIMLTGNPAGAEPPWITDAPVWLARKPFNPETLLAALPGLVHLSRATRAPLPP